jgi:hypothetical protein
VGLLDTHSAIVEWGDGTISQVTISQNAGFGTINASYTYEAGGIYTIRLILVDDDTGQTEATLLVSL